MISLGGGFRMKIRCLVCRDIFGCFQNGNIYKCKKCPAAIECPNSVSGEELHVCDRCANLVSPHILRPMKETIL